MKKFLGADDCESDLDVHDEDELDDIDKGETGGHKQSHPHCALYHHF